MVATHCYENCNVAGPVGRTATLLLACCPPSLLCMQMVAVSYPLSSQFAPPLLMYIYSRPFFPSVSRCVTSLLQGPYFMWRLPFVTSCSLVTAHMGSQLCWQGQQDKIEPTGSGIPYWSNRIMTPYICRIWRSLVRPIVWEMKKCYIQSRRRGIQYRQ